MISFVCSGCSARYSVKDEFAGKKTRCKKCNTTIEIPQQEQADLDPPELGFLDDDDPRPGSRAAPAPALNESRSGSSYDMPLSPPPVPKSMPLSGGAPLSPSGGDSSGVAPPPVRRHTTIADARPTKYKLKEKRAAGTDADEGMFNSWVRGGLWMYVIGIGGCILPFFGYQFKVIHSLGYGSLYAALAFTIAASACVAVGRQGVIAGLGLLVGVGAFFVAISTYKPEDLGSEPVYSMNNPAPPPDAKEQPIFSAFGDRIREANQALDKGTDPVFIRGDIRMLKADVRPEFEKRFAGYGPWESMKRDFDALCVRVGIDSPAQTASTPAPASPPSASSSSSTPAAPAYDPNAAKRSEDLAKIASHKGSIDALSKRVDAGGVRETFSSELQSLRTSILAAEPSLGQYGEYGPLRADLSAVEAKIVALPSREPEPELFTKQTDAIPWEATPEMLDGFLPEMAILDNWSIRVPGDAKLDLVANHSEKITWTSPDQQVSLSITTMAHADEKQQRPWVVTPPMTMLAREKGIAYIVADNRASAKGLVQDLIITHGGRGRSEANPVASHTYMALSHGVWLVAEVRARSDSNFPARFETAIRTLRSQKEKERLPGPLAPVFVAPRLVDVPDAAAALLKNAGKDAEPYVLEIAATEGHPARLAAMELLKDVGTTKSSALLWKLAYGTDAQLVKLARQALVKIEPAKADAITFAVEDLKLTPDPSNAERRREALVMLATNSPDSRTANIAPMLEQMLLNSAQADVAPDVGRALSVWNRPDTVDALLPFLNDPNSKDHPALDAVIKAASGTGDKKVAYPIVRWIQIRPEAVSDASITMGGPLEDELIKLLTSAPPARGVVCDTLLRMGTGKSIYMLERVSRDRNAGPDVQRKAQEALIAVRAREAENKDKK